MCAGVRAIKCISAQWYMTVNLVFYQPNGKTPYSFLYCTIFDLILFTLRTQIHFKYKRLMANKQARSLACAGAGIDVISFNYVLKGAFIFRENKVNTEPINKTKQSK